jgi:hypothetical protein
MAQATLLLVSLTLFTIMFGLGVGLKGEAIVQLRRRPALVIRLLIGSCLLVPLVALVLMKLTPDLALSRSARFGIALMALSPSAPLTLRKAGKMGGDRELAAVLQACAAVAEKYASFEPWFGMEQEYTFFKEGRPLGWPSEGYYYPAPQGPFYCGVGSTSVYGRPLAEAHMVRGE